MANPCGECPFKRSSMRGWLGDSKGPEDFLASFCDGEAHLPCHMRVDWESGDAQEQAQSTPYCEGALVYMRNQGKLPRNPRIGALVRAVEPDRETFLGHRGEFIEHHKLTSSH